jgi:hypothetical protein
MKTVVATIGAVVLLAVGLLGGSRSKARFAGAEARA